MAMKLPLELTIRDIPHSEAVETRVHEKVEKLNGFFDKIMACRVAIEVPQKKQHKGKIYAVRIDLTVPGEEIVINKVQNEDVYVAIRDAFDAAIRKLQDFVRQQRGEVKTHELVLHGHIARIFPNEGYGFIESNGSEYYFSRTNVVHPDFDKLEIGASVQFLEAMGDEGLQANRVTSGKHSTD